MYFKKLLIIIIIIIMMLTIIIMIIIINYQGKRFLKRRKVPIILTYSGGTIWSHHLH